MKSEPSASRRGVLAGAIYGLVGSIGAALGIPALRYLFAPPRAAGNADWADAGDISDLEGGSPRELTFRRIRRDAWKVYSATANAWVVKSRSGEITAFDPICTHLGCAYRWEGSRHEFVCPCHGSRFTLEGKVLEGPATRDLDRYQVKLEGTRLWLGPARGSGGAQS
jgi:menaquinol-cytochrome c reductase iron-sulfur subunit